MSADTKWIIGTVVGSAVAVVTAVLTVAGLLFAQIAGINTRIDDVRGELRDFRMEANTRIDDVRGELRDFRMEANTRIDDVRGELRDFRMEVNTRMDGFDTRLRNVEIAFGKIDQRLLTIERVILPSQAPGG